MRVAFHTLGCKVNHYETEAMKEAFVSRGAEIVSEEDFADVYIINTCTVTNIADRKSRQFIRRVKKVNPDALVAVTGCYAQVASDEVADMPEVDLVVGNGRKSEICGLVMQKLSDAAEAGAAGSKTDILVSARPELTYYEDMGQVTSAGEGMIRAYLKIQDGCDRFCSYCLIPYARGPVRSRDAAEIIEEAKTLMRDCKAFLFPTIYEGFGIPPLEAFSCGCDRIVVSDTEVMHEIFGDTVYYIDPKKFNVDLQNIPKIVEVSKMKTLNKYSWVLSSRKLKVCIDNAINNMK